TLTKFPQGFRLGKVYGFCYQPNRRQKGTCCFYFVGRLRTKKGGTYRFLQTSYNKIGTSFTILRLPGILRQQAFFKSECVPVPEQPAGDQVVVILQMAQQCSALLSAL